MLFFHFDVLKNSVLLFFVSMILIACGGSSEPISQSNIYPVEVTAASWTESNLQAKANGFDLLLEDLGSDIQITVNYPGVVAAENTQIYLDTDNDKSTGFSFDYDAWGIIGADYLIENSTLFQSLSNDSSWNWSSNVNQIESFSKSNNTIQVVIKKSNLGNPCTTINVGVMGRDSSWSVDTMYPVSTSLLATSISSCGVDTQQPVIILNGSSPMDVVKGTNFIDSGATATDDVDGNITANIIVSGVVDTGVIGNYTVTYQVADNAGNSVDISRVVKVVDAPVSNGITVDGSDSDWNALGSSAFTRLIQTSTHTLNVTEDLQKSNIYLLMKWSQLSSSDNFQLFLDTDNQSSTGYQLWDDNLGVLVSGAEYVIENGHLNKYTGTNGYEWSWQYDVQAIEFVHTGTFAEMKFPSSIVTADSLNMALYRVDPSWSSFDMFARDQSYSLGKSESKFSHVKMHYDLLNNQSIVWGEVASISPYQQNTIQSIKLTERANKGSKTLKVADNDGLMKDQLIVYRAINGENFVAQVQDLPNSRTISLLNPLEESVAKGVEAWSFYANPSHPNSYGYTAIADFSIRSLNFDSHTTGKHVLLGDSWFDAPSTVSSRLAQKLPAATIVNAGIGGNTMQDLINRFDTDVAPHSPDYIWIMSGTNDYWQGVTTAQFKNNLQVLINKSKAIGAKLIIIDSSVGVGTGPTGVDNLQQSEDYVGALIQLY